MWIEDTSRDKIIFSVGDRSPFILSHSFFHPRLPFCPSVTLHLLFLVSPVIIALFSVGFFPRYFVYQLMARTLPCRKLLSGKVAHLMNIIFCKRSQKPNQIFKLQRAHTLNGDIPIKFFRSDQCLLSCRRNLIWR